MGAGRDREPYFVSINYDHDTDFQFHCSVGLWSEQTCPVGVNFPIIHAPISHVLFPTNWQVRGRSSQALFVELQQISHTLDNSKSFVVNTSAFSDVQECICFSSVL